MFVAVDSARRWWVATGFRIVSGAPDVERRSFRITHRIGDPGHFGTPPALRRRHVARLDDHRSQSADRARRHRAARARARSFGLVGGDADEPLRRRPRPGARVARRAGARARAAATRRISCTPRSSSAVAASSSRSSAGSRSPMRRRPSGTCGRGWRTREQEELHVIGLDVRQRILVEFTAAVGSVAEVQIDPRDVFRPLLQENAHAAIVVHNHPSGATSPSESDVELTRQARRRRRRHRHQAARPHHRRARRRLQLRAPRARCNVHARKNVGHPVGVVYDGPVVCVCSFPSPRSCRSSPSPPRRGRSSDFVGVRAMGMGEAQRATATGASGPLLNPGGHVARAPVRHRGHVRHQDRERRPPRQLDGGRLDHRRASPPACSTRYIYETPKLGFNWAGGKVDSEQITRTGHAAGPVAVAAARRSLHPRRDGEVPAHRHDRAAADGHGARSPDARHASTASPSTSA